MKKILIIKLGAMGDVLRTTPILRELGDYHITWVTDGASVPLLLNNKYIDRLVKFDYDFTYKKISDTRFDHVICLDEDPRATSLAFAVDAKRRHFHHKRWNIMSVDNDRKKWNRHSYQYWIFEALGLEWKGQEYVFDWPVSINRPKISVIGLETRVGKKWKTKNWTKKNWTRLEKALKDKGYKVIKFRKKEFHDYVQDINSCDLVISPDTLTMHLALALRKPVIALFTSTSPYEIYDYGRMTKLVAPVRCNCCYKKECYKWGIKCANSITVDKVMEAVEEEQILWLLEIFDRTWYGPPKEREDFDWMLSGPSKEVV